MKTILQKTFLTKLLLLTFIPVLMFAQYLDDRGIKTNILSSNSVSTTIEYIVEYYDEINIEINDKDYIFYSIPGSIWLMEKGLPQLPADRKSIVIPDLAATNFNIISAEYELIETLPVMPSKGHFTRDIDPAKIPYVFDKFYESNAWYPEENIILDEPYIVRDLRGQTIQFNPMQYNPAEGKIKLCRKLIVEIYNDITAQPVNPLYRTRPLEKVSQEFHNIYKSLFINYGYGEFDYIPLEEIGRLLIVYHSSYASNIIPFYNWKLEKGITTLLAEYPTQTGTGPTALKNYIQNLYDSPEGLTFIILVGESNQIPTINGVYEGAPSDPCYVKLAGTDAYPDAFISRISPTSAANLDYILHKLIRYEKYPDSGPNADWYLKGVGIASNETGGTGIPDWQRMNLLKAMLINVMHFTQVDEIYDPGASASQVTASVNDGRSIINYIGHGSGSAWSTTGFNVSQIHNLNNGYKNPFIIDVACLNGNFTMGECMEEAWLRAGNMENPKGAIGVYGSSTNASWVPPCDMQYHAIDLLTSREKQTAGGVCFNGLMYAMDLWGGSSGEGLKLMEQYNLFGDCSMLLALGAIPDTIAPEPVTDLLASQSTSNSILLTWTSPFDSTFLGVVSYDVRYSTDPIVTNNDFQNANQIIVPGDPDTAGIPKSYTVKNLSFSTLYYFAIKALDLWGNKSEMSNVVSGTTWGAPVITVTPDSLKCILIADITHSDSIFINNISSGNSTLDYQIELKNNTFPGKVFARLTEVNIPETDQSDKENQQNDFGVSFRGAGGPDLFGYEWIDSNEPDGPEFEWNDISETGIEVTNWIATGMYSATDEGKAGPFNLGFNFKFYGIEYDKVWFGTNGFISFNDITGYSYTNDAIPEPSEPNCIIAGLWDDLNGGTTGKVYYKSETDKFIVQYTNWPGYSSSTGPFTFQIVLYKNGKIMVYYKSINGTSNSCTVGIENHDGTDGLQVVRDASYLENNLALKFSAEPEWLTLNHYQGTIFSGGSVAVVLSFVSDELVLGDYSMDMVITSNDPVNPEIIVPVKMTLVDVPVELTSLNAENKNNDVIISWKTATEKNNKGFEIERQNKTSGKWEKAGFIEGKGTTTEPTEYIFKDENLRPGIYLYRLKQVDFDGSINYSKSVEVEVGIPKEFALEQNYPNPFNPSTIIRYHLPVESKVVIKVYNILGKEVAILVNEIKEAGIHEIEFINNGKISSGIYFYTINAGDFSDVKKFMLMK